jgi:hypothetical protein
MTEVVNFNLNKEQQERFNIIYEETKKIHPHLVVDEVSKQRVRVLIAYNVINGDIPLPEKVSIDLDNEIKD